MLAKFNWQNRNHITSTVNMHMSCPLCSCVYVSEAGDRTPMHKITAPISNQGTLLCHENHRQFRNVPLFYICVCMTVQLAMLVLLMAPDPAL